VQRRNVSVVTSTWNQSRVHHADFYCSVYVEMKSCSLATLKYMFFWLFELVNLRRLARQLKYVIVAQAWKSHAHLRDCMRRR
jgi:hypothetical protein